MKFLLPLAAAAALLSLSPASVLAHEGHTQAAAASPQTVEAEGVVRAINPQARTLTVAHGPIAALRWPAMTMNFRVQSADLLRGVTVGSTIHFVLQNQNGQPVITAIHAS